MTTTAGPWQRRSIPGHLFELHNAAGETVLRARSGMMPTLSDAILLASAPDLLEAARHAIMEWRLHGQLTDSCRVLEAAVAKATGEDVER